MIYDNIIGKMISETEKKQDRKKNTSFGVHTNGRRGDDRNDDNGQRCS